MGGPSEYVMVSFDVILMMTSCQVVATLAKLFVKIVSLKTRLNDLIGNI